MLTIKLYRGREGLNRIAAEWSAVLSGLAHRRFFHSCEWFQSYLEALEPSPDSAHFFVGYRGEEPVVIVPLRATVRRTPLFSIALLESSPNPHMPLSDILCHPEVTCATVLADLAEFLRDHRRSGWDVMLFRGVPEESLLLGSASMGPVRVLREAVGASDFFACDGGYESIAARFSKNFRANLRKARNKLSAQANVEFRSVTTAQELPTALHEFLELEASGWKGEGGAATAIRLHPELLGFYRSLTAGFSALHRCRINLLTVDARTIAAQFCLLDDDTLYLLKIAHDESYAKLAPGNLLLEHVLKTACADPAIRTVSLVTDSAWHADWKPLRFRTFNVTVYNSTLRGLALYFLMMGRRRIRRLRRRSEPSAH